MNQEYTKTYSSLSNSKLIEILIDSGQYDERAIAIAKAEFKNRNISESEREEIEKEILNQRTPSDIETKLRRLRKSSKKITFSFSPNQPITSYKAVLYYSLLLAIYYVYNLFNFYGPGLKYFSLDYLTFGSILTYLPILSIPISIYLLIKKNKAGWILNNIHLTYILTSSIISYIHWLQMEPLEDPEGLAATLSQLLRFDHIDLVRSFLFYGLPIYFFSTEKLTKLFNANLTLKLLTTAPIILIVIYLSYPLFSP